MANDNFFDLEADMTPPSVNEMELAEQAAEDLDTNVVKAIDTTYAQKEAETNPGSLERTFLKSLKSMFNQTSGIEAAGAAVIASMFGGSEAGAAAFGIGQKLGQDRIGNLQRGAQLEIQAEMVDARKNRTGAAGKFQKAEDTVDARNGDTLVFNPNSGTFQNTEGKAVPSKYIKNLRDVRTGISRDSLGLRDVLGRGNLSERVKGREFKEVEAQDLGAAQLKDVINADVSISQTKDLMSNFKDPVIGPVLGRAQTMAEAWTGKSDPKFTKLKTQTELVLQSYGKFISGTAMSDQEKVRLERTLPSVNDSPQNFQIKAREFDRQAKNIKNKTLGAAKKYQGRGPGVELEGRDKQLLDWANKNPNDPRAKAVKAKLGVQ